LARSEKHKPVQSNKQKRKSLATEDQIISKQLHKVFGTRASYYRNLKGQGRFSVTFKNAQELQHLLNYFSLQIPEP